MASAADPGDRGAGSPSGNCRIILAETNLKQRDGSSEAMRSVFLERLATRIWVEAGDGVAAFPYPSGFSPQSSPPERRYDLSFWRCGNHSRMIDVSGTSFLGLDEPMHRLIGYASAVALTGLLVIVPIASAGAFQLSTPAPSTSTSASAFINNTNSGLAADTMLLSPRDVEHIRWCATRYRSYHAVDNTYANRSGSRVECQSPAH